jgi:hypothetical protein
MDHYIIFHLLCRKQKKWKEGSLTKCLVKETLDRTLIALLNLGDSLMGVRCATLDSSRNGSSVGLMMHGVWPCTTIPHRSSRCWWATQGVGGEGREEARCHIDVWSKVSRCSIGRLLLQLDGATWKCEVILLVVSGGVEQA